jgi:predicted PurR-regulated permease PerM
VSWWLWVLIWVLLVLFALFFLFLLLRQVWRKLRLLTRELSTASDRLAAVTEELQRLQDRSPEEPKPAVFDSPTEHRARRFSATRTKQRQSRRRSQT